MIDGTDAAAARQMIEIEQLLGVDFVPVELFAESAGAFPDEVAADRASNDDDRATRLEALREEYQSRIVPSVTQYRFRNSVFGEGSAAARLMFVGEAPGADEDRTGRPFVGRAGQKLNDMITAIGLSRDAVYIANVLKIRPPENRNPLPDEVERDAPFLARQIRIIQPDVLVALGGPATKFLLDTTTGITRLRGQWGEYVDPEGDHRVAVMPTFHPAYLLRNYTRDTREKVWHDLQAAVGRLADA